jgi:hypothetical protein
MVPSIPTRASHTVTGSFKKFASFLEVRSSLVSRDKHKDCLAVLVGMGISSLRATPHNIFTGLAIGRSMGKCLVHGIVERAIGSPKTNIGNDFNIFNSIHFCNSPLLFVTKV